MAKENMLRFEPENGRHETITLNGRTLEMIAWRGLDYCENPLDPIQKLNVFMPAAYAEGKPVNGYTRETAPVFLPNAVGGYMPGPAEEPGADRFGQPNTIFQALEHGYVTASGGIRGRTSGKESREFFEGSSLSDEGLSAAGGVPVGRAPALIVDYKAVIRYLKWNQGRIPGNPDRIITNGTSAGGALSAMAGASGNHPDYLPYLKEIGAADAPDDIFAASCYCPIHNLEHADAAYEWLFSGETVYHALTFERTKDGIRPFIRDGELTKEQQALSAELAAQFPAYVNGLGLKDPHTGAPLTLDKEGNGPFRDYVEGLILQSAKLELETGNISRTLGDSLMVKGSKASEQTYFEVKDKAPQNLNWPSFVSAITRMKAVPAFDALDLSSPENEEFGTREIEAEHFTETSMKYTEVPAQMAQEDVIRMINPVSYIGKADTAPHWRIRHGVYDRDTSLAIPAILGLLLQNAGFDTDLAFPWGLPHSGDYDLPELFAWIDSLCRP